jgi:hypothetical protein
MSSRQNEVKVFKPNAKQADFTVRGVAIESIVRKLALEVGDDAAPKVRSAFRSLKRLGAESLTLRVGDRRYKVQVAKAA